MSILKGRECMVEAVVSAAQSMEYLEALREKRLSQLSRGNLNDFNLTDTLQDLRDLLSISKILGNLTAAEVDRFASFQDLLDQIGNLRNDTFIGIEVGADTSYTHFHHIASSYEDGLYNTIQGLLPRGTVMEAVGEYRAKVFNNKRK